ncbi:J domain-containing protein [Sphingobacterium detergens]|uniref:J domain-containing protein n=1 Tax=Sphingobacterium detergens TaxID=1145106 RepID=A0A420ARN8_SPHD1|nr:J domain-containing protein [Sphingobacterium detergens]RKE47149.1 hypothetical protein DFQ12_4310 [Sphingobacterium detergens]
MKYFKDCTTLEEVKALYKKLAKENHPDLGGGTEVMQQINIEFAFATARIIAGAKMSAEETEKELRFSEEYRKVIEQIIHLPGIIIELVGLWIWVTGDTKPVSKELGNAKLFYAPIKKAWYYRSEHLKAKRGSKKTLDQIKDKYGSEIVRNKDRYKAIASFK